MSSKRSIRDLEKQCKKEPENLVVRLLLAAAYREAGRTTDAVPLYRSVADAYNRQGRRTQAVAVLRSLLELDPVDAASRVLLEQIERDGSGIMTAIPDPGPPPGLAQPVQPLMTPNPTPLPGVLAARAAELRAEDPDRPPTIPSLDPRRQTGSHPSARVLSEDVAIRELAPVRPPGVPASARAPSRAPIEPPAPPPPPPVAPPRPPPAPARPPPAAPARPPAAGPTRSPLGATLGGPGPAGPGARLPSPTRGSSGLYTPTPLPTPIPFHEVDVTGQHERAPAHSDDDAATRIADSFRAGRASFEPPPLRPPTLDPRLPVGDTTTPDLDLATELDTRRVRRLSEHELGVVGQAPPGLTDLHPRLDHHDLDDTNPEASPHRSGTIDDEPTRLAGDEHASQTSRSSNEFEAPTGVRDRATAAARVPDGTARPVKTPPPTVPATPSARVPREAQPTARARPLRPPTPPPISEPIDEPTRVAGTSPQLPGRARHRDESTPIPTGEHTPVRPTIRDDLTTSHGELTPRPGLAPGVRIDAPEEPTDPHGAHARVSRPGMHRSKMFPASFNETLEEMDPDGGAIDSPLDMFSMLPPQALVEMERRVILRRFAPGEIVIREGDPGDACYVIIDGEVRVLKADPLQPDAGPVELARLGNRALFGEFALLADRRRHATVQATTHTDLYEIPRQVLRDLAVNYAEVGPALETFYRQRLLATLLRTAPFFTPLPEDNRARLLARFVPIRAESGESIVREGQPAGGLYLIVIGAVEITRRLERNRSVILATLREGAYFGEMSLLSGDPTTATVIATGSVELALLQPRDFYEIASEHPELWSSIRREARARALENARLVAGETGTV